MRTTTTKIWIAGLIAFLILAGYQAEAQRDRGFGYRKGYRSDNPRGYGDGSGPMNRMESALDLTEEQKTQMEQLRLDMQKKLLPTSNEIREKNAQLNTLITENASQSKINQLIDEISNLRATISKAHVNTHLQVRELLSDDQKIKFDTHFSNRLTGRGQPAKGMGRYGRGRM